jgi:Common central domain of tyrosinase
MIRQNFVTLSASQRDALAAGLNALWTSNKIQNNADMHENNFHNGIHMGPAFLPWHRDFLLKLEKDLQLINSSIAIPYWDWTRTDSRNLDAGPWKTFFGGRSNSGGKFDHWTYTRLPANQVTATLPSLASVITELAATSFLQFRRLEYGSHVPGHTWTGHTMASGRSPLDPLFFLHHGNIDRLWSIWQLNNASLPQYDHTALLGPFEMEEAQVPPSSAMVGGTTPTMMLDHAALGYTYDADPALQMAWLADQGTPLITTV